MLPSRDLIGTITGLYPLWKLSAFSGNPHNILSYYYRENGIEKATEADCYYVVKYFDSDEDGCLNFQDFLQVLMPCDNQYLRAVIAQRPNYAVSKTDYLGRDVEAALTMLFEK
jgi:hypothetical protein